MGWVGGDSVQCDIIVISTPDGNMYPQDIGPVAGHVELVRDRPADSSFPCEAPAGYVYDFAAQPTRAELLALQVEAQKICDAEILRLGWPRPRPAVTVPVVAPPAEALVAPPMVIAPWFPGVLPLPPDDPSPYSGVILAPLAAVPPAPTAPIAVVAHVATDGAPAVAAGLPAPVDAAGTVAIGDVTTNGGLARTHVDHIWIGGCQGDGADSRTREVAIGNVGPEGTGVFTLPYTASTGAKVKGR